MNDSPSSNERLIGLLQTRERLHDAFRLAEQRGEYHAEMTAFDEAHCEVVDWMNEHAGELLAMLNPRRAADEPTATRGQWEAFANNDGGDGRIGVYVTGGFAGADEAFEYAEALAARLSGASQTPTATRSEIVREIADRFVGSESTTITATEWLQVMREVCASPPAGIVQIGIKRRSEDGRSEYLWWDTPAEGSAIYALDYTVEQHTTPPSATPSDDTVAVFRSLLDQCRPYVVKADREGPQAHPKLLLHQIDVATRASETKSPAQVAQEIAAAQVPMEGPRPGWDDYDSSPVETSAAQRWDAHIEMERASRLSSGERTTDSQAVVAESPGRNSRTCMCPPTACVKEALNTGVQCKRVVASLQIENLLGQINDLCDENGLDSTQWLGPESENDG